MEGREELHQGRCTKGPSTWSRILPFDQRPISSYWNKKHVSNFSPHCRDFGHCLILREGGGREGAGLKQREREQGRLQITDHSPSGTTQDQRNCYPEAFYAVLRKAPSLSVLPSPPPLWLLSEWREQGRTDCFRHCVLHIFSASDNIHKIKIGDKFIWKKLILFPDDLIMYPTNSNRNHKPSAIPKKLLQSYRIQSIQKSVYAPFTSNKLEHMEEETSPFIIQKY